LEHFRLPGVALEIAGDETPRDADATLIFGGDGTVHRQLPWLIENKVPFLIVPEGSGNDFARSFGYRTRKQALELWRNFAAGKAGICEVDAGAIQFRNPEDGNRECYFCGVASLGLDASANRIANSYPRWLRKHGGYLLAALTAIVRSRPMKANVSVHVVEQVRNLEREFTLAAIANIQTYGGGIPIAPNAEANDGLFEVCLLAAASSMRLLRILPRVVRGRHLSLPEVTYVRAASIRIETATPQALYADGEYIGVTPIEITMQPRALRVIAERLPGAAMPLQNRC
jgi:diacylglycerol kinase (ATP)